MRERCEGYLSGKKIIIQKQLSFLERIDETCTKAGAMLMKKRRQGEERGEK